LKSMK